MEYLSKCNLATYSFYKTWSYDLSISSHKCMGEFSWSEEVKVIYKVGGEILVSFEHVETTFWHDITHCIIDLRLLS